MRLLEILAERQPEGFLVAAVICTIIVSIAGGMISSLAIEAWYKLRCHQCNADHRLEEK